MTRKSILLQPPTPTQICSHKFPIQQTEHIPPAQKLVQRRSWHHPRHYVKQWFPCPQTQNTQPQTSYYYYRWTDMATQKWAFFTCTGKRDYIYYQPIQKTDVRIELRTNNTVQKLLMPKQWTPDKYTRSGTYKLTCPDCNKAYIGQTGRSFIERFYEHKNAFKTNSHVSNYAEHILEQTHS